MTIHRNIAISPTSYTVLKSSPQACILQEFVPWEPIVQGEWGGVKRENNALGKPKKQLLTKLQPVPIHLSAI